MKHGKLEQLAKAFFILGHPSKLRLLQYIMDAHEDPGEPIVPTMAAAVLEMSVSKASYSLKRMAEVGVLDRHVTGRYTFYSVNDSFLALVKEFFR